MITPDYNRDLAFAEMAMGNIKFVFDGIEYPCIPSTDTMEREAQMGGMEIIRTLLLTVRANAFGGATLPVSTDIISYKNKDYTVERISADATETFYVLTCVDVNQGA